MPDGGCFCGKTRFRYTGEVQAAISGSTYSTNIIVPGEGFEVTSGTPKTISKKADSGSTITSFFCPDCGSTLFRESETFGTNKVVKVGVMDDVNALNQAKPGVELYVPERVEWVPALSFAGQKKEMPNSADA